MSYILDALKKLENEKGKKKTTTGMVSISGELFKDEQRRTNGGSVGKIAFVVVAASLVTFGATWYFLKDGKERDIVQSRPALPVPAARYVAPPPPASVTAPSQVPAPQAQVAPALPPAQTQVPQSAEQAHPAVKQGVPSAPTVKQRKLKKERRRESSAPLPQAQPAQMDTKLSPPPADIKISGIAWQDERGARRAVVNGFLMHEGSVVSGARITDILKDRVRFTQDGRIFEVPFVASGGLSELGK